MVEVGMGALSLQCMASDTEIGDIDYVVTRAGAKYRSGSFVSQGGDQAYLAVIGPLPVADDYTISLHSRLLQVRDGENSDCTGRGSFSVSAGQTTAVTVDLQCGELPEHDDSQNVCPSIDAVRATPSEAALGVRVELRADAHDADKKLTPLQFAWTTQQGLLTDPTQSVAGFTCTRAGLAHVTLKISDGDHSCREESITVVIACRDSSQTAIAGAAAY
jgi:hypothetical protein